MLVCLLIIILTTGLIIECLDHLDNILMRREYVECLDLLQFLYFFYIIELFFHALDGNVFARLEGQGSKDY